MKAKKRIFCLIFLLAVLSLCPVVFGYSSTKNGQTASSASWTNPSYALVSDNQHSTYSNGMGVPIKITNFGFNLPANADVNNILVKIEKCAWNTVYDYEVKLVKNGSATGNNKADFGTAWPISDTVITYGTEGASDTWGVELEPADINSSNFGVQISAAAYYSTAAIDSVEITVDYTIWKPETHYIEPNGYIPPPLPTWMVLDFESYIRYDEYYTDSQKTGAHYSELADAYWTFSGDAVPTYYIPQPPATGKVYYIGPWSEEGDCTVYAYPVEPSLGPSSDSDCTFYIYDY